MIDLALPHPLSFDRPMRLLALVMLGSIGAYTAASFTIHALNTPGIPTDVTAYWLAAQHVTEGGLYASGDPNLNTVYRYAPWLAWAWMPLLNLPLYAVAWGWAFLLTAATIAACLPVARMGPAGMGLSLLLGPGLYVSALSGNVMPLMICALVYLLPTRWGPVTVGVAGSLKIFPLALALGYAARREWRKVVIAFGTAAVLWLPALLYDIGSYTTDPGDARQSLFGVSPLLWAGANLALIGTGAYLAWRRSEWAWVVGALLVAFLPPRTITGGIDFLLPAVVMISRDLGRGAGDAAGGA